MDTAASWPQHIDFFFNNERGPQVAQVTHWYHTILMQCNPLLDSIFALFLLLNTREAEDRFPGVNNAQVEFWDKGTIDPSGRSWEDYVEKGKLPIGVLGSPLDEHASDEFGDRKKLGYSTTRLVAKELRLDTHPLYKRTVDAITRHDLNLDPKNDEMRPIANVIKEMHRRGDDPHDVIAWTFKAIRSWLSKQQAFLDAQCDFSRRHEIVDEVPVEDLTARIAFIRSNNDQMGTVSRTKGVAALIQRAESGHIVVHTSDQFAVDLSEVARQLRAEWMISEGRGQEVQSCFDKLASCGQLAMCPGICLMEPGRMILNGGERAPGVDPFPLNDDVLIRIVCRHVKFTKRIKEAVA